MRLEVDGVWPYGDNIELMNNENNYLYKIQVTNNSLLLLGIFCSNIDLLANMPMTTRKIQLEVTDFYNRIRFRFGSYI